MDKIDLASALLASKHNKTDIPEDVKKAIEDSPPASEGTEVSEQVLKDSAAICSMINEHNGYAPATGDENVDFDSPATQKAFHKWMSRTTKLILRETSGKKIRAKYVTMFLDGVAPKEAAAQVLKKRKVLKEKRKAGILALLQEVKSRRG